MVSVTRIEALNVAKAAVRAYSRDPTQANAAQVEAAWRAIRTMDAVAAWRREDPNAGLRARMRETASAA